MGIKQKKRLCFIAWQLVSLPTVALQKVTLITGASSGIGLALSRILAKNGHDLILVARNAEALHQIAYELRQAHQVQIATFSNDISKMSELQYVVDAIRSEGAFIEYIFNNAGLGDYGFFQERPWDKIEQQLNVNMKALSYICHAFLPAMKKENRGHIVNIASTAAFRPGPLMAIYFATKAFVLHFTEAVANELKDTNISITAVCPGPTATHFASNAQAEESDIFRNKKLMTAEEVAEFAFVSMMKRKTVAIPGFKNRFLVFLQRFAPRKLVTNFARLMTSSD